MCILLMLIKGQGRKWWAKVLLSIGLGNIQMKCIILIYFASIFRPVPLMTLSL